MTTGIYAIIAPSGNRYIGSAANIAARWRWHRNALLRGDHHNEALLRAFAKYGDALRYEIIETCEVAHLVEREQAHIDTLPFATLYNGTLCVEAPMRGKSHKAETRAKMSEAATGRKHSDEVRARMCGPRTSSEANKAAAKLRGEKRRGVARKDLPIGSSGYRGVYKQARGGWFARVGVGAQRRNIGTFKTTELAYAMRLVCLAAGVMV